MDLAADGSVRTEFVDAPVPRRLARLRGSLEDLLTDARHAEHEDSWLQVTLTDTDRPAQAMERLRRRFPHTLVLGFDAPLPSVGGLPATRTSGRSDHDVVAEFFTTLRGRPPADDEAALLREAVDSCCEDDDLAREQRVVGREVAG